MHRYSGLVRDFSFLLYCKMTTTTNAKSFTTNSVKIVDNSIVVEFTSDWNDKVKKFELTDKWVQYKDKIAKIFAMPEYHVKNIWNDIKKDWPLYTCVKHPEEDREKVMSAFAEIWLGTTEPKNASDIIDTY